MFERKTDDFLPKAHLFREKVLNFFSGMGRCESVKHCLCEKTDDAPCKNELNRLWCAE